MTFNRDYFEGKWQKTRGLVRQRWAELTNDDLDKLHGRYEQFVGLLQEKYGYTRDKAEREIQRRMNEGFMANRFRRNQGKQDYENALAELQAARDYSQGQALGAYAENRGRMNNMLASSDMWGGGAAANMALVGNA